MSQKHLLKLADCYAQNRFSLLGSQQRIYASIPWYEDVKLRSNKGDDYSYDIKVPWQLARFQYAPILAHAFAQTNNTLYFDAFKNQIISFLDAAPFLHGIHWKNPMEVSIRATNWIVAYQLLHGELQKDTRFHERFVHSLWQHIIFIENNWELYDGRTNNHYLSNLVGYAYLTSFFNDSKRWKHCWKELQSEFAWQIQDDGTSYEGSTAYHKLVSELFVHGFLVAKKLGEIITPDIQQKCKRMLEFAEDTKQLCIGDDDSGTLLHHDLYDVRALASDLIACDIVPHKKNTVFIYKNFGLSTISYKKFEISLRHHVYSGRQPSAHFHEDVGSITLSYNGIPILVDPGSYLYTGSTEWRNYFRSSVQHSGVYPRGWSQKSTDLFALNIPKAPLDIVQKKHGITSSHMLFGYKVSRTILWDNKGIMIHDDVRNAKELLDWNFIFSSAVTLKESSCGVWDIIHEGIRLLTLKSDLQLYKRPAWVSPCYGVKYPSWALSAFTKEKVSSVTTSFYP